MHKIAQKVEEKLTPKFAVTTPGCSMVKIARLNDAFLEVFWQKAPGDNGLIDQEDNLAETETSHYAVKYTMYMYMY